MGDCHAMGARAATALAVVALPFAAEPIMEETLFQLMWGARQVLDDAGCALVGGHTSEGEAALVSCPSVPRFVEFHKTASLRLQALLEIHIRMCPSRHVHSHSHLGKVEAMLLLIVEENHYLHPI